MKNIGLVFLVFASIGVNAQGWEKKYDFVDEASSGLSKIGKNGKIGYADKKGKEIISLEYNDGLSFSEGYVAVKKDGKWMYFDSTGKAVTEAIFDDASGFQNGLAVVSSAGLYGFINNAGQVLINYQFSNARSFSEGLAPAANAKGNWGFIDKQGNWVIKAQYGFADNFANHEAKVMKGDKTFYIDKENKMLHEDVSSN